MENRCSLVAHRRYYARINALIMMPIELENESHMGSYKAVGARNCSRFPKILAPFVKRHANSAKNRPLRAADNGFGPIP